jgi:L-aminopeptidase/D-esterase-like protein
MGSVGAGAGAAIAMWRGEEAARKGGIGSAALRVGDATVAALVVLNAGGDIFTLEGNPLTGGSAVPFSSMHARHTMEQTTLVAVATDAAMRRVELHRLCVRAHDALGACIRPVHTRYDGDAVFAVSTGGVEADLDALGEAAFEVVGRAIESAVLSATALGGLDPAGSAE